jgi:16S rRNA pseudouridine516 synthase
MSAVKRLGAFCFFSAVVISAGLQLSRLARRRALAQKYYRELLLDPSIARSLLPYPNAATVIMLSSATKLAPRLIRRLASNKKEGESRPWLSKINSTSNNVDSKSPSIGTGEAALSKNQIKKQKKRQAAPSSFFYFVLHKPINYTTKRDDESTCDQYRSRRNFWSPREYERTVYEVLPTKFPHVPPVGRLDKMTSGVLLFTDDGAMATRLLRPDYEVSKATSKCRKVYEVHIEGFLGEEELASLRSPLQDEHSAVLTKPAEVEVVDSQRIRVTISEGRKHQVRRLCARANLSVLALVRTQFGPLVLRDLLPGEVRALSPEEVRQCCEIAGLGDRVALTLPLQAAAPTLSIEELNAALDRLDRRHGATR